MPVTYRALRSSQEDALLDLWSLAFAHERCC